MFAEVNSVLILPELGHPARQVFLNGRNFALVFIACCLVSVVTDHEFIIRVFVTVLCVMFVCADC